MSGRALVAERAWHSDRPPEDVWAAVLDFDAYRSWWPWLTRFDPPPLVTGAQAPAVVRAPAGYRLRLRLSLDEVEPPHRVRIGVEGDIQGRATVQIRPEGPGSELSLSWALHPHHPWLRALAWVGRPLLVHGHHRIVDDGLARFRRATGMDLVDQPTDRAAPPAARRPADVLGAALLAGVASGAPSTAHALLRGLPPLAATRAAGMLLGQPTVTRGLLAHSAISVGWAAVLASALPRRRTVLAGALAGGLIAALDLGVVGRRIPAIRDLPTGPQVLDHIAFGALVGLRLSEPTGGGSA